jgi:hypothetical protein
MELAPLRDPETFVTTDCELDVECSALSVWLFCPLFQLLRLSAFLSRCNLNASPALTEGGSVFQECNNASSLQFF